MQKYLNTTTHSVAWFKRTSNSGDLIISPPFQRNPVWSLRQQSALIDTILMEYPIPEIYMQELTDPEGGQKHILVDGQQRIRTVLSFLAGDFELEEDSTTFPQLNFEDLGEQERKKIFEYNFVVRVLPEMPDVEVRAIFQRLNRNTTTLNAQELRHATYWGPFIKLMEEVSDFEFWGNAGIFSANDVRRMLDIEFISEITVAVLNGLQNKKKHLEEFYQLYETKFEESEMVRNVFVQVLGEIDKLLPNITKTRWRKKSDFYTLFVTLAQRVGDLPLSADRRVITSGILTTFGSQVDAATRVDTEENVSFSQRVLDYTKNVERSASDLGSRRERERVLKEILAEAV